MLCLRQKKKQKSLRKGKFDMSIKFARNTTVDGRMCRVTLYSVFETSKGVRFSLKDPDEIKYHPEWEGVTKQQIEKCGFIVCYHLDIVEDQEALNEIYEMIKQGKVCYEPDKYETAD